MLTNISKSVERKDHSAKITGKERYTCDYTYAEDGRRLLTGRLIRADRPHAGLLEVKVPELPEGYFYVDGKDAPVNASYYPLNDTKMFLTPEEEEKLKKSMPVFAMDKCEYAGQPVGMIVGPVEKEVRHLAAQCKITYQELPAVVRLEDATEVITEYSRSYGNVDAAFLAADYVYEETFSTGRQYQAYLETQSMIAEPQSDGSMFIRGSIQCPNTVLESVEYALDVIGQGKVRIRQEAVGGAFGGKEDFPSFLAPQVAVAAKKTGQPVKVILDRKEDLQFNFKRHPSITKVRIAVQNGKITAMDIDGRLDVGAYLVSSGDVAIRYETTLPGIYSIANLRARTRTMKTNTPPTGAFRGFGGPQAIFAMEMAMSHLADQLGVEEVEFKKQYMAAKGSRTSTGGSYYFDVPLPKMIEMAEKATDYSGKRAQYSKHDSGRLKRGIGISFANHGCPLMGDLEWKYIKPRVRFHKNADGTVEIFTSQAELGQGIRTAFCKIAAEILEIPYEKVFTGYPDTEFTENTGITAASRSVTCVGKAVENGAMELKKIWKDGEQQEAFGTYTRPEHDGDFDPVRLEGNQYADYSWSVVVVEVLVDPVTGNIQITDAYGVYNLGTPIDENILTSQMEGGLAQAIGYCATERLVIGNNGKMFNTAFTDYHMPTATDLPQLRVELEKTPYPGGPFGAKGAGEIPLVGVAASYLRAVEQAISGIRPVKLTNIPFVPENVLSAIDGR